MNKLLKMSQKSFMAGSDYPPLAEGVLRIYSMRFCPYAQRTRLVLLHKNIPHETINIHLMNKPDWFLARNPFGLVPTLQFGDKVIYESNACDAYLDEAYPGDRLIPSDLYKRAQDQMLIESFSKVISAFYKIIRDPESWVKLKKHLMHFEKALDKRGHFYGGSKPSMVDFSIWPWLERLSIVEEYGVTLSKEEFPLLTEYIKTMFELPVVKSTMFDKEHHLHFLKSLHARKPDYDYGLTDQSKL